MTINERDDAMLPTYPAVLLGGVIEWGQGGAPDVPPTTPIPIHVTLLSPIGAARSGAAMAEALAILAATGGPSGFGDPTAWQQETRADRQLPGRTD